MATLTVWSITKNGERELRKGLGFRRTLKAIATPPFLPKADKAFIDIAILEALSGGTLGRRGTKSLITEVRRRVGGREAFILQRIRSSHRRGLISKDTRKLGRD